jgi:hypothetical protein
MHTFWIFIGVVIFAAIADVLWTIYIQSVNENKAFLAALFSGLIFLVGGVNVIAYTHNPVMLLAAALGGFLGTYITVRRK